jgi:starvation-inducible DNA-binding protein
MATIREKKPARKLIRINTGLDDAAYEGVSALLNGRLADTFMLYAKLRKYHWNVTGMHFHTLHELFEEQYEALEESMDEIAERVRQMSCTAIGTLAEFKEHSAIQERPGEIPNDIGMLRDVLADHELIIRTLRENIDQCSDEYHDEGTADFLTGLMEAHEKMAWMIRAHFEDEPDNRD